MTKNIFISSDHGGFYLKEQIVAYLLKKSFKTIDLGTKDSSSVDYPDYSNVLVHKMMHNSDYIGILLFGTGIGMAIAANRYSHIRAALCTSVMHAKMSRLHNNANILALGSRLTEETDIFKILETFFKSPFEGDRHEHRINKIDKI